MTRILTCEQEASPTRKYRVNKHATKISRLLPIIGNSSLSAVMIASEPPNYKSILILTSILQCLLILALVKRKNVVVQRQILQHRKSLDDIKKKKIIISRNVWILMQRSK